MRFDESTQSGLKDKKGYEALLRLLTAARQEGRDQRLQQMMVSLMYRFVSLREEGQIELIKFERVSVKQYRSLIHGLLAKPTGGLFPVILVSALLEALAESFSLAWQVESQGINVADRAKGVGGDITVRRGGEPFLTVEVTERPVDTSRVVATFAGKISPLALWDYVFAVHLESIEEDAREQAERYFAQGFDVNFVDIEEWLIHTLVTVGRAGRTLFQSKVATYLSRGDVPKALKVAWNDGMGSLVRQ